MVLIAKLQTGEGDYLWMPSGLRHPRYAARASLPHRERGPGSHRRTQADRLRLRRGRVRVRYCGDLEISYSDDYDYLSFMRTYRWNLELRR